MLDRVATLFRANPKKPAFISVCKNKIQANNKRIRLGLDEALEPPIRFQIGKGSRDRVVCNGANLMVGGEVVGRITYTPNKAQIKAGAKVTIEWFGDIEVIE